MIAITTSNSIRVNPNRLIERHFKGASMESDREGMGSRRMEWVGNRIIDKGGTS